MRTPSLKFPLLLALAATVTTSCSDGTGPVDLAALQVARCAPESAGVATATIGEDGGTISVGRSTLVVPRRSLKHDVEITMQVTGDSSSSVVFLPEGLKFDKGKPAELTLSYSGCLFASDSVPASPVQRDPGPGEHHDDHNPPATLGVVHLSDELTILAYLAGVKDSAAQQITADLSHFSRYAIAW